MVRMAKRIDNDRTKGLVVPFLILAHVRTGGTFLAHALSNHPQVYCDRGETLHHLSSWRSAKIPVEAIIKIIWNQDGYHAAGFRAIYRQAFHPRVWPIIQRVEPRIIHLVRRNVARQGISFGYQQLVRQGKIPFHPVHTFEAVQPDPVFVDPKIIACYARKVRNEMLRGQEIIAKYPGQVLEISYEDLTGDRETIFVTDDATIRIENFLGIQPARLSVRLRRDFDVPMARWFKNWAAVRSALVKEGFKGLDQ